MATKDTRTPDEKAERYHKENPHIFAKFEELTFTTLKRGFRNYGASGIFELIRWHTGVSADNDIFKIDNNYKPFYARLFEKSHPEHEGFFRLRVSSVDSKFYNYMRNVYKMGRLIDLKECSHDGCENSTTDLKVSDKDQKLLEFWFPGRDGRDLRKSRLLTMGVGTPVCPDHYEEIIELNELKGKK